MHVICNDLEGNTARCVTSILTFDLYCSCGLGTAGWGRSLASVGRWVCGSDDVKWQTTETVLVVGRTVGHRRSVLEPLDQRRGSVAFQTTLEREPAHYSQPRHRVTNTISRQGLEASRPRPGPRTTTLCLRITKDQGPRYQYICDVRHVAEFAIFFIGKQRAILG